MLPRIESQRCLSIYIYIEDCNQLPEVAMMHLISLVENLVRQYIKVRNCIVLLTLSMTDDTTNSSAARIVKDVLNARKRTVSILTKSDHIQSEEDYQQ